jgi:hypothetical protein
MFPDQLDEQNPELTKLFEAVILHVAKWSMPALTAWHMMEEAYVFNVTVIITRKLHSPATTGQSGDVAITNHGPLRFCRDWDWTRNIRFSATLMGI